MLEQIEEALDQIAFTIECEVALPLGRNFEALEFARSAFRHACAVCGWDPALAASADGTPPPVV